MRPLLSKQDLADVKAKELGSDKGLTIVDIETVLNKKKKGRAEATHGGNARREWFLSFRAYVPFLCCQPDSHIVIVFPVVRMGCITVACVAFSGDKVHVRTTKKYWRAFSSQPGIGATSKPRPQNQTRREAEDSEMAAFSHTTTAIFALHRPCAEQPDKPLSEDERVIAKAYGCPSTKKVSKTLMFSTDDMTMFAANNVTGGDVLRNFTLYNRENCSGSMSVKIAQVSSIFSRARVCACVGSVCSITTVLYLVRVRPDREFGGCCHLWFLCLQRRWCNGASVANSMPRGA